MNPFDNVTHHHLEQLGPAGAVALTEELLWAEARRLGIGAHLIDVPRSITTRDGGVDAEVTCPFSEVPGGLIKRGRTRYQIKAGKARSGKESIVNEVLFKPRSTAAELNTRVKSCVDSPDDTLVVLLFGYDAPDQKDDGLEDAFRRRLATVDAMYAGARLEVWRQNQIIGALGPHLALRCRLVGVLDLPFSLHKEWAEFAEMRTPLHLGPEQAEIAAIRSTLRRPHGPTHLRVLGDPGIGKTGAVLEATRTEDLAPLVIYFDNPRCLMDHHLAYRLLAGDNETSAIVIVDDCDPDARASIWNRLESVSPKVQLITIWHDEERCGAIEYVKVAALRAYPNRFARLKVM